MTVSVLLITHEDIGNAMLHIAQQTYGELPLPVTPVTVSYESDPDELLVKLKNFIREIGETEGVLILTDMFGSTPCNLAQNLEAVGNIKVISGLNLPMLIRILNYPTLTLNELAEKAISGGKEGVIDC
ncbi:MAG: PTS sugar transporter subunit IIA [Legionellales bacterium]|nr:PTS sugar transporter subunit IIA [Legionellales bacterium]